MMTKWRIGVVCLLLLFSLLLCGQPVWAEGVAGSTHFRAQLGATQADLERSKILSALESKTNDLKSIETAREKLLLMDKKETHLLSILSDRIIDEGTSVSSNIAFLLMTLMITLS